MFALSVAQRALHLLHVKMKCDAPQAGIISDMMDDAMEDNSEEIEDETEAEIDKARCVSALAMHACLKASYCCIIYTSLLHDGIHCTH